MKEMFKVFLLGLVATLVISPGCSKDSGGSGNADEQVTAGFTYKVAAVYEGSQKKSDTRAPQSLKGTMTITDQADMSEQVVDWYVVIDEQAFTATSNKTYVLAPGDYTFDLVVDADAGNHQYVGSSSVETIADDGGQSVPITIRPVIGEITVGVALNELAAFKLSYPAAELVDVTAPRIGIAVDGGPIQMFSINVSNGLFEEEIPTTPMWSSGYLKLVPGSYHLDLTLYEGANLIGKSIDIQENVTVYSDDLTMDLIPLHGEAVVTLPMEGSDAVFNLVIPNEVVEEVGSTFNLFTLFQLTGSTFTNVDATGDNLTKTVPMFPGSFQPCGLDTHCATVTLPDHRYDVSTLMLMFADMAAYEQVGMGFLFGIELNDVANSHTIPVTLVRRNLIQGNVLGVLGVNVYDLDNNPVQGATILSDNVPVGITGTGGTFGTSGYAKLYLLSGVQTIRAEYNAGGGLLAANLEIDLSPLEILNIDLVVESADCSTMDCNDAVSGSTCAMVGDPAVPTCECTAGWSGSNCQDYDPCEDQAACNQAGGGGTCADAGGAEPSSAECTCNEYWTSSNDSDPLTTCDTPPAICDGVDCNQASNGGSCQDDGTGSPECICNPGFSGSACENWDPCAAELNACHQAEGQGTCADNAGVADCTCSAGWLLGDGSCNDPDWCISDPCNGNGTCNEAAETCSCDSPYVAPDCTARIDDDVITCRYDSSQSTGNCIDYPMVELWDMAEATAHCTTNATASPPNMVLVTGDSCLVQNADAGGTIDRCYAPELCGVYPSAVPCPGAQYYYGYLIDGYENICDMFMQGEWQDGPFAQVPYALP